MTDNTDKDKSHSQNLWPGEALRVNTDRIGSISPTRCSHSLIYELMMRWEVLDKNRLLLG